VDGGFAGDRFAVFNGTGNLLGATSSPVNNYPVSVGIDFDAAFADANYSRGEFLLGPGNYQIFGYLLQSALDDNSSAIDATVGAVSLTAVPLPAAACCISPAPACWAGFRAAADPTCKDANDETE